MTNAEKEYEQARFKATELRQKLMAIGPAYYIFRPMKVMLLVNQFLHADTMAWLKMSSYLITLAADKQTPPAPKE